MKRLLRLLLVLGMVGCGPQDGTTDDSAAALERFGAKIERNEQSEAIEVGFFKTWTTDAELVHLAALTKLQKLFLSNIQVTDAGVAELKKALPNCEISH